MSLIQGKILTRNQLQTPVSLLSASNKPCWLLLLLMLFLDVSAPQNRIVGGYHCDIEDHPFLMNLHFDTFICGGSIVNSEWILTAAHCIDLDLIRRREGLAFGGSNRALFYYNKKDLPLPHRPSPIVDGIVHPKYYLHTKNGLETRYDVALVRVWPPLELDESMQVARFGKSEDCVGERATVVGWGNVKAQPVPPIWRKKFPQFFSKIPEPDQTTNVLSAKLRCAELPLVNGEECKRKVPFPYKMDNTVVCTLKPGGGMDACGGDSGGPLVCQNKVVGVVSTGIGCALAYIPAMYTRVWDYADFIYLHTGRNIHTG